MKIKFTKIFVIASLFLTPAAYTETANAYTAAICDNLYQGCTAENGQQGYCQEDTINGKPPPKGKGYCLVG